MLLPCCFLFFFFNDTATTEIYTLSLHDALPISSAFGRMISSKHEPGAVGGEPRHRPAAVAGRRAQDRKSTRLNSSHLVISYAVFCLKKKKNKSATIQRHHHRDYHANYRVTIPFH